MKIRELIETADASIPTIEVKADLLRDFLERLEVAETRLQKQLAVLRERGESRDTERAPGGWAKLSEIERTSRKYMGAEFANLEASVGLLKRLCAAVRDGNQEEALRYVDALDSGADDRPWDRKSGSR